MAGVPVRVHDMCGDDLGIARVPRPVETGDLILLERGEYRVLEVIPLEDEQSPLYALVRAQPGAVRPLVAPGTRKMRRFGGSFAEHDTTRGKDGGVSRGVRSLTGVVLTSVLLAVAVVFVFVVAIRK
jgi:hypothetical protein